MSSEEVPKNNESQSSDGFTLVMKWSLIMFVVAIAAGLAYRVIMPVELHLDESEYIEKVFVEFETRAWRAPGKDAVQTGTFDGGSILYVIESEQGRAMVRPFAVSRLDSVWIEEESLITYTPENYRRWQYEEERRKYDLD